MHEEIESSKSWVLFYFNQKKYQSFKEKEYQFIPKINSNISA